MSPELSVEECIISESISSILAYGMLTACNLRETHCDVVIFCLSGLSCRCEEEQALQMRNIDAAPVIITLMIGIVIVSADASPGVYVCGSAAEDKGHSSPGRPGESCSYHRRDIVGNTCGRGRRG
jgi:hypothetical protein